MIRTLNCDDTDRPPDNIYCICRKAESDRLIACHVIVLPVPPLNGIILNVLDCRGTVTKNGEI